MSWLLFWLQMHPTDHGRPTSGATDVPDRTTTSSTAPVTDSPNIRRLQFFAILIPTGFVIVVDFLSYFPHRRDLLSHNEEHVLLAVAMLAGIFPFSVLMFRMFGRINRTLIRQNDELRVANDAATQRGEQLKALNEAGLTLTGEPALEPALKKIVDLSRGLVGASYGALTVLAEDGEIERLVASDTGPIPPGIRAASNPATVTASVEGIDLETPDFLGIPIVAKGASIGHLYLARKEQGEFTVEDEETLSMFASQAAATIVNSRLQDQVQALAIVRERERIAREMHDNLAQVLGYVSTKAQAAQEMLRAHRPEEAQTQLLELGAAARDLYADVRESILGLRSSAALGDGLQVALQEYVELFGRQSGISTKFQCDWRPEGGGLPPTAEAEILRIVQEALSNVRKHSAARRVVVHLGQHAGAFEVSVEDDGDGFDPSFATDADPSKMGITTMRERSEAVGATFNIESVIGHGTRVVVAIPRPAEGSP